MDRVSTLAEPLVRFSKDSVHFINRCTKPDQFKKNAIATAIGFLAMGVLGFIIKLIFVPINSIIVGN
ncbi:unnamed protein product [Schistosoma intercalatum]|nr:unnamed protein product [Schistosoma intercalatum]